MTQENVDTALAELARRRGVAGLALDAEGCASLETQAGWPMLLVLLPPPSEALVLYAELGVPEDPLALYRKALTDTHLWRGGQDFTLGVAPESEALTAAMIVPADDRLEHELPEALERFERSVAEWLAALEAQQAIEEPVEPSHSVRA